MDFCKSHCAKKGRCTLPVVSGSKHCFLHRRPAYTSYRKYKKAQRLVDARDHDSMLHSTDTNALLRYYADLKRVHDGRQTHQLTMFHHTARDIGHSAQIEILFRKMTEVNSRLHELYSMVPDTEEGSVSEDSSLSASLEEEGSCSSESGDNVLVEDETDIMLSKCIKEVEEYNTVMITLKCKVVQLIASMGVPCRNMTDMHISCAIITSVLKFVEYGFFSGKYTHTNTEKSYRDINTTFVPLCDNDVEFPLATITEQQLRLAYLSMLTKRDRAKLVISKVMSYYFYFLNANILKFRYKIVWDDDIKDLTLAIYVGEGPQSMLVVDVIALMCTNACSLRMQDKIREPQDSNTFLATPVGVICISPDIMQHIIRMSCW